MFGKAVWARSVVVFVAVIASGFAAQAQAQGPALQSNSQKYREKNETGSKGRAGGASLTARLLYAKNGTTDLEATTGEFGSPTPPPGTIWKMHVSALDALGVVMSSQVYNNLDNGGYFKQTYTNLWPGQPFQIQAHVRTSAKRNDTVAVTASVQKRPDLAVDTLVSPPLAPVNLPIKMFAVVSELNGNIGGRTDCVLYVNDVEADRAAGVWVDSGDSVSCAFSPSFTTLGTNRLTVRAEAVDPGDWDMANNVFEKEIVVSSLTPEYDAARAEALVYDVNNISFAQQGRFVNSTFTAGLDWLWEEKQDTDGDIWTYTAVAGLAPLAPPTSVKVSLTDGVLSWSAERALSGCEDFAMGQVNGRTVYTSVIGCGAIYVQAGGYSGTVTYTSRRLEQTFKITRGVRVNDGPAKYVFNNVHTDDVNGTYIFNGNNWTINVQVVSPAASGGIFTFGKELSFSLGAPLTQSVTSPTECTTGTGVSYCQASSSKKVSRYGEITFIKQ
jgi:hypothetical protein